MSIVDRSSLEQSSLSDLHAIASELSIDSFRRLRKAELVDAILERQGGEEKEALEDDAEEPEAVRSDSPSREEADRQTESKPRRRRLGRRRKHEEEAPEPDGREAELDGREAEPADGDEPAGGAEPEAVAPTFDREEPAVAEADRPPAAERDEPAAPEIVEGVVEVLPGGSGFVRVNPPDPSDDDVYVSGAQVRRCELVTGDRVSGPRRGPRRSERFASLVRVETVNGQPVAELGDSSRFEDLPVTWPRDLLPLAGGDLTISKVLAVAPIGRGSRVTIVGPAQTGKTELLRRLAAALANQDGLELRIVLAGVRPEEIAEWDGATAAIPLGAPPETRNQAVDAAIDQARRLAVRGAHAVVLIDTLDGVGEVTARKAMAAARALDGAGSVTVIAAASRPVGGETTVVSLSPALAAAGRWPALDLTHTWTMRAELLVGDVRAQELARSRAQALSD
jgi:transcription termination factor Rho